MLQLQADAVVAAEQQLAGVRAAAKVSAHRLVADPSVQCSASSLQEAASAHAEALASAAERVGNAEAARMGLEAGCLPWADEPP